MKKAFVRQLPKDLTSYDFLKSLAVITMIIDHIGMYFFPDQIEWRIVGRMSLPIWMFLVGYASTRTITPTLLWGAGILIVSNIIAGQPIFPLNILATIIVTRLLIDYVMQFTLSSYQNMFLGVFALVIVTFPTLFIFEYGGQAMMFAMFGYVARRQQKLNFSNEQLLVALFFVLFIYIMFQRITIGFDTVEFYTMAAGVILIGLMLSMFQPKLYPDLTKRLPMPVTEFIKLMGRQTLEIYVVHLLFFKIAALWLYPERFGLFQWSIF